MVRGGEKNPAKGGGMGQESEGGGGVWDGKTGEDGGN